MLEVLTVVLLAGLLAAAVTALALRVLDARIALRRRVIVNLDNGEALEGVLWARRGGYVVLRSAVVHAGGQTTPADGEVLVERARVTFTQAA